MTRCNDLNEGLTSAIAPAIRIEEEMTRAEDETNDLRSCDDTTCHSATCFRFTTDGEILT